MLGFSADVFWGVQEAASWQRKEGKAVRCSHGAGALSVFLCILQSFCNFSILGLRKMPRSALGTPLQLEYPSLNLAVMDVI